MHFGYKNNKKTSKVLSLFWNGKLAGYIYHSIIDIFSRPLRKADTFSCPSLLHWEERVSYP